MRRFIGAAMEPLLNNSLLEDEFNQLALELYPMQRQANPVYRAWCAARGAAMKEVRHWSEIPSLPIGAFKEQEVTCLEPTERCAMFQSSGTTGQTRSRHFHSESSLALYEASLDPWFRKHLLPELDAPAGIAGSDAMPVKHVIVLAPEPDAARNSSLGHMLGTVMRPFQSRLDSTLEVCGQLDAIGGWELSWPKVEEAIRRASASGNAVLLLGTAFLFVHLLDELTARGITWALPRGSRLMETGGYKGRSRALSQEALHDALSRVLGLSRGGIVCEYGMSELSSQAYDTRAFAPEAAPRCFRFPPWARVQVISPETGRVVQEGETGMLKVVDLANVASVLAIQTEDLGIRRGEGFEWVGRAKLSEPRGCSLLSV